MAGRAVLGCGEPTVSYDRPDKDVKVDKPVDRHTYMDPSAQMVTSAKDSIQLSVTHGHVIL